MATLTISRLYKQFGSVEVLKGIDLEAQTGEFVALVGPLRLRQVDAARHDRRAGKRQRGRDPHRRQLVEWVARGSRHRDGVPYLCTYPTMTARQHDLRHGKPTECQNPSRTPRSSPSPHSCRSSRSSTAARSAFRRPAAALAMGRALVRDPKLFLFDEPCPISTPSCASTCAPRSRSCT